MLSSHLLSLFVCSLALSVQAASVMPTRASEDSQHIGHKTQYMPYHVERRSFNIGDFPLTVLPTTGRVSSPIVLKLHPPVGKPSHLHANLPLRFGRRSETEPTREHQQASSTSFLNLPQRFGREQECSRCTRSGAPPSATLPQRFGRRHALRTLDWLPFRKVASILVPASESSEVDIRNSFDDNRSKWTEDTAVAGDSLLMDF